MAESALTSMQRISTPSTIFLIKDEKIWNVMLSFVLESNILLEATCVLFDDQCNKKILWFIQSEGNQFRAHQFCGNTNSSF